MVLNGNMKKETRPYNDQLDEIALEVMKCIMSGTYSHPIILEQLDAISLQNKRSMSQEISHRAYSMAAIMLQIRKDYLKIKDDE